MTERLHFRFSLLCIGEGNGNPLQCSSLENPRDGVAQSRTRLKRLSSSNRSCGGEGYKTGPLRNIGSFLGTDSPWTHWRNKLCFTVLSVLRGEVCFATLDSAAGEQKHLVGQMQPYGVTTTVLSFFCPPGFSNEWTSQGKKTLKVGAFLSPKGGA